jgi:DNA replication protein DnaC
MGSISRFNRPSLSADSGNWRISHSSGPARALVFLGPPGTGKTHLSLALADRALTAGYSVLFTTLAELAQALESASHPGLMRQRLRRYIAPNLLVIDEVGYTKLSQEQAHHFFELVTARYEHGSIILTSNTSFGQWGNLLGDEVLATALLDRLLHHAEVIPINGRSYRMKERQAERTGFSAPPEVALGATGGKSNGVG